MAEKRKYVRLLTAACPACGQVGGLKEIIFGEPSKDFEFDKYISGGCVITGNDPEIGCVHCDWAGMRNELEKK